jgi:molybdate transport system substrate-binding protein
MRAVVITIAGLWVGINMANAAEINVISANAMREVLAETKAKFEADTRNRLVITVVETGEIRRRVLGGEAFDVIMVPRETADELEKAGKMQPGAVQLIRVRFGLAVPTDGPRPDVSTPEALKNTLLRAKTVVITDPTNGGISGVNAMDVLNKLGIADEMQNRLVPQPGNGIHAQRVVRGEADLAIQAEHEIRCVKGATFLPYPVQFQRTIVIMGGIGSTAGDDAAAAKDYLAYLTGADTANTYSAHCLIRG